MFTSYEKRNTATKLRESEGWTKENYEYIDSRLIYADALLDISQFNLLRTIYGGA